MKNLKEKRELQIDNKIFTKSDLADLFRLFISQSNEILEKSKEIRRQDLIKEGWLETNIREEYINTCHSVISLIASDNSNYTFSFEEVDEAIKTLDSKVITEVELQFNEKVSDCMFIVKLRNSGTSPVSSYVVVEGQDSVWLNSTIMLTKDLLLTCRNQSLVVTRFRIPIIVTIIGLLSFFLLNLTKFFIRTEVSFPKIVRNIFNDDLIYYIILFVFVSATPAILVYRWLKILYPAVEIQTGPFSGKLRNERRNKLLMMCLLIIVPVMISILLR